MAETPKTRPPEKLLDLVLRRTFHLCGIAFLVVACWFGWRLIVVTQRVEAQIDAVEARLQAIDDKVGAMGDSMAAAKQRTASALQLDDLALLMAAIGDARDAPELEDGTPEAVEEEISALLAALRAHEGDFLCDGDPCSAFSLHARLYAKRLVHGDRIATTDQFIERVASHSMAGLPYRVPGEEGSEPERLSDWLQDRLSEHRAAAAGP